MTTEAAAALYLAQHLLHHAGRPVVIHNPNARPIEQLPVIYGFNNGGSTGWLQAVLITEDGVTLGGHCCSEEGYMPADLGIIEGARPDRHEAFRQHYPDGYRMEFVRHGEVPGHKGLQAAFAHHAAKAQQAEGGAA